MKRGKSCCMIRIAALCEPQLSYIIKVLFIHQLMH
jgi:hypothetical protein